MVEIEKVERKEIAQKSGEKAEEQVVKVEKAKSKERPISEIILHPKPASIFLLLLQEKQWNIAALARDSNQSYVYATELIKTFEKSGLVSISSSGRRRIVKLTEKGGKLAHSIEEIMKASLEETKPLQKAT